MWFAYQLQGIPSEPTVPGDAYGQRIVFLAQLRARQVELDRGRIRPVRRVGPLDAQTFGQGLLQLPAIEGDYALRFKLAFHDNAYISFQSHTDNHHYDLLYRLLVQKVARQYFHRR